MSLISEMLQRAFENGEEAAQLAHEMKVPTNHVPNPYQGHGRNIELAWSNGFNYRMTTLNPGDNHGIRK